MFIWLAAGQAVAEGEGGTLLWPHCWQPWLFGQGMRTLGASASEQGVALELGPFRWCPGPEGLGPGSPVW